MAFVQNITTDSMDGIWEQHEPTIRRLYEAERKTLKQVKQTMESEHGFPIRPLSTYETKLRDRLGLRKKLKKADWIAVHHHYLARDGKDTGIYLNGTRIPWKKAWKEIRRSGARSTGKNTSLHTRLPANVIVRTPSPIAENIDSQSLLAYQEQSLFHSSRLSAASCTDRPSSKTLIHQPQNPSQLPQGYWQSTYTSMHNFDQKTWVTDSLQLALSKNSVALWSIPSVTFRNEMLSIANKLEFNAEMDFISSLPGANASIPSRFWQTLPLSAFLEEINPTPASTLSAWNTNAYHLIAEAIYLISNGLTYDHCEFIGGSEETCPKIIQLLLKRIPRTILRLLFQSSLPTIRSVWDVLAPHAAIHGYKDIFILLIEVGLRHPGWIHPRAPLYLSSAVSMGATDVVRNLLKAGIRADSDDDGFSVSPAIIEAAATGNIECAELLLGACDVNRIIYRHNGTNWYPEASTLQKFVYNLSDTRIWTFPRRDHAYPLNSVKQTQGEHFIVDFDLENESRSRILDMVLNSGANVDMYECDRNLNSPKELYEIYDRSRTSLGWRLTILERSYYRNPKLFNRLIPYSTLAIERISRPDICLAAKQGKDTALFEYLLSKSTDARSDEASFLELVLVEQFLEPRPSIDFEVIRGLIEFGVDPKLGSLPLDSNYLPRRLVNFALKYGYGDEFHNTLKLLVQSGVSIDNEVLEEGVEETGIAMLQTLSRCGANMSKYGAEALLTAACLGNYEAVSWLLEAGVDINATIKIDSEPRSIISLAITSSSGSSRVYLYFDRDMEVLSYEMFKYLIDCGALLREGPDDLNGFNFLRRLVFHHQSTSLPNITELVLDTLLDLNGLLEPGECLLEACLGVYPEDIRADEEGTLAVMKLKLATFELLLRKGITVRDSHVLASLILYGGRPELIQKVLNAGVDVNAYSQLGDVDKMTTCHSISPIQAAASKGKQSLIDQLIRKGADVNSPALGFDGRTALQAVCEQDPRCKGKLGLVQFLIDNGADVNAPPARLVGLTALQAAASAGDLETALLLIHYGANPNAPPSEKDRESALDKAAGSGRLDMVQFLLNIGALSWTQGRTGYRGAIWAAKDRRHPIIINVIREHIQSDLRMIGTNLAMTFQDDTRVEPNRIKYYLRSEDEVAEIERELDEIESEMLGHGS